MTLAKIEQVISELTFCTRQQSFDNKCVLCKQRMRKEIRRFIDQQQAFHFVLPAFPAKSANRLKTISELPDLGERLALLNLQHMLTKLNQLYQPGATLTICSDGHVFNDVVMVEDSAVDSYQDSLVDLARQLNCHYIDFFSLQDHYPTQTLEETRAQLINDYGQPLEEIKQNVLAKPDERLMFNGLHKFLLDDLLFFYNDLSKNKIRKLAKVKTYQTIQRSHSWSALVAQQFPEAIRLSIHAHDCAQNKIFIKLIAQSEQDATPWHNVVVKSQEKYMLMKRKFAIKLGAVLKDEGSLGAYYAL
jgi:pyoverdine/dityrosine biosynthesis protein Dit1